MKSPAIYICLSAMLLMFSFGARAQNKYIDSLKKALPTQKADSNKVKTLINISESYKFFDPDSALAYGKRALSASEKLNFDAGIFWSIVAINKALFLLGNYALELDYAFKAYPLGTKLNDPQAFGWSNGMMGDCYFNLGEYGTAISYYRKILRAAEKEKRSNDLPSLYSAMVPVLISLHQYDSALIYAKKGGELLKQNPSLNNSDDNSKYAKCLSFRFLGEAYAGKASYDSSLFYYRLSLPFYEDIQLACSKIDVYNGMATVYKEKNRLDSATWYAKKALTEKMIKAYPVGLLKAANTLTAIYELQSKPDSTLKYLRIAFSVKDSLFNRGKTVAVQNIFLKEEEKKRAVREAETTLQNRYRAYLLVALLFVSFIVAGVIIRNRRIRQLQDMRNSIADDLHDDIGSTLSSISIMSELAKARSPEASSLLTSIEESTSTIQENMSDIVWAVNPKNDRFENVLLRMNEFASEILDAKNIELDFTSDASLSTLKITMRQRKNLYLFFKEVINNAAKYSDAKKVSVSISQRDRQLEMNISDDGKGFDTAKTFGGNGMSTLKKRGAELSADFKIRSLSKEGTLVKLKFKIT
jgi:two-component system, NarL family, sensor histidine kinase UhpB